MLKHHAEFDPIPEPDIVQRALALCNDLGFTRSCRPEVGQLLHRCASAFMGGRLLELGTGCGVGTTWMASGLHVEADTRLITVDTNPELTLAVSSLFSEWPTVEVRTGDWRDPLASAPFDMIFVDVAEAKASGIDDILDALANGGLVLIDDLTPMELWPAEWRGRPDPIRETWLNHPRLDSVELRVAEDHAVILARNIQPRGDAGK